MNLCGDLTYTATYDSVTVAAPATYKPDERILTVDTDDVNLITNPATKKAFAVTAEFTNWPVASNANAPSGSESFDVVFTDGCIKFAKLTAPAEGKFDGIGQYDGNAKTYTVPEFTSTISRCVLTYACDSVTWDLPSEEGASKIQCDKLFFDPAARTSRMTPTKDQYLDKSKPPATYTVSFTATVKDSMPVETKTHTAKFTLIDVCDPPKFDTSIRPNIPNQTYIVTDKTQADAVHADWVLDPPYCTYDVVYNLGTVP